MRDLISLALVLTLTISPVMAENPPALKLNTHSTGRHFDNSLLGTSILMSLPARPAALPAMPKDIDSKAPGVNKSVIIGLLILAGATTAVILLWPHGHDKPQPVAPAPVTPVPTGTILAAGTPVVNSPNQ
jgi:hypothetical protein